MNAELWELAIYNLPPFQKELATLELDTVVTLVLKSGYIVSGEVWETEHPTIMTLAQFDCMDVERRRLINVVKMDIAEVCSFSVKS